jgi:hypothetical protein
MGWLREHRIGVKYALIATVLIGGLIWLERAGVVAGWAAALDPAIETMAGLGLAGAFLLGLLGNSSIMLQVPYTVPMLSAALAGAPLPYLLGLGFAAGLGATVGELVSYTIADQVLRHADLAPSRLFRWVQHAVAAHPRAIPWLVFGFAATLLPDDAVLIPLAMISYGAGRIILPLLLGKLAYCLGCAALFHVVGHQAGRLVSTEVTGDLAILGLVGFFVVIAYQVESANAREPSAGSVESGTDQGGSAHGTQGTHRSGRRLHAGNDQRGGGRGDQAHRHPR